MKRAGADCLVVGLGGPWPSASEAAWLVEHQPAGVILFSRNVENNNQLRDLCSVLRELVPDLEISADHEGGPVSQLAAALGRPPVAWALGVLDDVGLTARVHRETGNRLKAAGIDRVMAPVADVLTEIRNPVIGARAFGSDPTLVSRHTVAAVTGLLEAGVKVCLKHWPGHGGSDSDSHLGESAMGHGGIPAPFEAGLTAGAGSVMVGHLLPAGKNDGEPILPATLDAGFLSASRGELEPGHVENLILFADDVTMGALGPAMERLGVPLPRVGDNGLFDPASLPREWFDRLVAAGCDRLLIRGIPEEAFPLTGEAVAVPDPPVVAPDEAYEMRNGVYGKTRRLLWAMQAGEDFADPEADLWWLDFSRDDRWEAASGRPGETLAACRGLLESRFRSVLTGEDARTPGAPIRRILVSSHRPLPTDWPEKGEFMAKTGSGGVCLTLGHPSLKSHLEAVLGHDWRVGALYDIAPEDLFPGPGVAEQ